MSLLLAALSGVLGFLAFPHFSWWPLVFVTYAPLFIAVEGKTGRRRFGLGLITGTVHTLGMQYWIAGTLVNMSHFPWAAAIPSLVLYSAYHGLMWALVALFYGPVRAWSGRWGWLITVPLMYAVVERVFPSLFPYFACSPLYAAPVLLQASEWIGPSFLTALVILPSCGLVHMIEEYSRGRASDHLVPTAIAALWLMVSVWGVVRMQQVWSAPIRSQPTVALIQPNVTVDEKNARDPAVRKGVYARTEAMTRRAARLRPDLVVWPEGGFPFTFEIDALDHARNPKDSRHRVYSRRLYRLALELGVPFVAGALRRHDGRVRNSGLFFPPGEGRAIPYDKRQLLLFGERVPFADTFPSLRDAVPGMSHHVAGERFVRFDAAGFGWVPSICYEAIQPTFTRDGLNAEHSDILLNLTNDVWFGNTAEAPQHLMVQTQRAIENRVWLVRSTNSGISAFVDPTGTIRAATQVDNEAVLAYEMAVPALPETFYRRFGDLLFYVALVLAGLWLAVRNVDDLRNFVRNRGVKGDADRAAPNGGGDVS